MNKILWTEEFSVGVAEFDQQHKKIIGLINQLIDNQHESVHSELISDTLAEMTEYTFQHFRDEEAYLKQHDYPLLSEHTEYHKAFRLKTANLCDAATMHVDVVPKKILLYLKEWWTQHILAEDMQYKGLYAPFAKTKLPHYHRQC